MTISEINSKIAVSIVNLKEVKIEIAERKRQGNLRALDRKIIEDGLEMIQCNLDSVDTVIKEERSEAIIRQYQGAK